MAPDANGVAGTTVVASQNGEARPEPPHRTIDIAVDAAGRMITGPTTDATKLIDQFGVGKVLVAFFLGFIAVLIFAAMGFGFLIRSDVLNVIREKDLLHFETLKTLVDTTEKREALRREDDKDREMVHRDAQAKQWQQLREITASSNQQVDQLKKATDIMTINGETMRKSADSMEKTASILEQNNALLKKIVEKK